MLQNPDNGLIMTADSDIPPQKNRQGLLKSGILVSALTVLSRILGLIRDMVFAFVFGAAGLDVFVIAFKVPNFFRRLFGEGAFTQAFVPVLSEYHTQRTFAETRDLINHVSGMLGAILLGLSIIGVLLAPVLAMIFAPGWIDDRAKLAETTELLRLTFPYILFISLTACAGAILNSYDRFAIPALTPVLMNIILIGSAMVAYFFYEKNLLVLAWGVLLAGVIQLGFQLPFLQRLKLLPRPRLNTKHEGVKQIMVLMLPALFSVSVGQLNVLLDTVLASFLEEGAVAWLFLSDRLANFPLGVFGIAIGTVILPTLSRKHSSQDPVAFRNTMDWGLRLVVLIGLPASVGLWILAEPMVASIYYRDGGAITEYDVLRMSQSLQAYAVGVLAVMGVKVLIPGYFSRKDMKTPVKYGIIAMSVNMVLNLLLWGPLGHVGLALATSLAAYVNVFLLMRGLKKLEVYQLTKAWWKFMGIILLANVLMIGFVNYWQVGLNQWLSWPDSLKAMNLLALCLLGVVTYSVVLWGFGLRPAQFRHK